MKAHDKHARERYHAAAREYVEATEKGDGETVLLAQARLKLAAKDFVRAERESRQ
jgi:hypothetical protein